MAFLSRFFARAERVPLPTLEDMLQARGIPMSPESLGELAHDFQHLTAEEQGPWMDALEDLHTRNLPLPIPWLDAQYELLPQLVPAWQGEREGFHFRPFIEGLSQRVLVAGQVMPTAWLTLWGVTEHDVLERALDHLREKSKGTPFQRLPSGVYQSAYGDGLDASRLLLPELWRDLFPGQNTFVAVPTPTEMLVAPQVILPKLVEAINKALAGPMPRLQATIYQVVADNILPATLQDPHPIAQPQRELRQGDLLEAYRAQERDLDPALGTAAPVGILRTQQGRSISFTLWSEGHAVLLPETDVVGFMSAQGRPLGLFFRTTLPRIPELHGTVVETWGPRRLRYDGFPTGEQLERLERFATPEQMAAIFKASQVAPPPASTVGQAPSSPLAQGSSPVPPHLRDQRLGVQSDGD